ncbi:DUF3597 family protein [Roseimicrobium gellanilyticum]|nr:DUF3597 family protein [Roseimicrobium gellanilyticum]
MNSISPLLSSVFQGGNAATARLSETFDRKAAAISAGSNWRDSIVDLAKLIGMNGDLASRRRLATELEFFGDFNDTAMMNIFLHNRIILTIVENHAVDIASKLDQLVGDRAAELDWRDSVVDLMTLFGLHNSVASREQLATKLGYTGELGTSGTMNMWLHERLIILIVDRGGTLPDELAPKSQRTPKQRVESLCRTLKTKDTLVPALVAIWERRKSGKPFRNDFENRLYGIFNSLSTEEQEGLGRAFDGFTAFRRNGQGECLFSNHLADAVRDEPPENNDFAAALLGQGLALSIRQDFLHAAGKPGPGQVRPWRKGSSTFEGGAGPEGPWPWLTSLSFGPPDTPYWFGNLQSVRPVPPASAHAWAEHQFEKVCSFTPLPTGGFDQHCVRKVLNSPPPSGGMQLPPSLECEGGVHYTMPRNECLRIPARQAGNTIWLRGFNFIATHVNVHFQSMEVPARRGFIEDCLVFGDNKTPVRNEQGKAIVDMRVKDDVAVQLPMRFQSPDGTESPFPPGLYEIWISVGELPSNRLVLRIEPDENTQFDLECEGGRCIKETPGLGDDEVSWTAFVGHLVPNHENTGRTRAKTVKVQIDREPWKDIDDDGDNNGEVHSPTKFFPTDADLAGGGPAGFLAGGVRVISIVGFEVDSAVAAEKQIHGFSDAFTKVLTELANSSISSLEGDTDGVNFLGVVEKFVETAAGGPGVVGAASLLATGHYMMAAMAAAIVASAASLWAVWAPADLIALDIFALNARECWDRTDADKPLPPDMARQFRNEFDDTDVLVTVLERQLPKTPQSESIGPVAIWKHEVQYRTQHDGDEFSNYLLRFKLTRRVIV